MADSFRLSEILQNHMQLVDGKIFYSVTQNVEFPLNQAVQNFQFR